MSGTRWRCAALALLFALAPPMRAACQQAVDEEYARLCKEYDAALQKWNEAVKKLDRGAARPPRPDQLFLPRFRAYAEARAGQPAALPALTWMLVMVRPADGAQELPADVRWAINELALHAQRPEIGPALRGLHSAVYFWGGAPLRPLFQKIYQEHPEEETRAEALFNLGFAEWQEERQAPEPAKPAHATSVAVFRKVLKEFPEAEAATKAESYIFEVEHLQIGMKAPDFAGEDEQGRPVKLSDFRGRVVVVDFWGFW